MVYTIVHHHKEACLLTAGSYGAIKVWKVKDWEEMEEDGQKDDVT